MLSIDELSVRYRTAEGEVEALTRVSLSAARGSTLALVGESGSGKSTVALAAMGLLPQEAFCPSGQIVFDGRDLMQMASAERRLLRGRRLGLVFQDPFSVLNPSLRIGEQVAEGLIQHRGMARPAAIERSIELLDEVGIRNPRAVAQAYPHELSGGMRQRALIAGALAPEPDLLILDEPTTALDVTIEAQILELLEALRARRGLTMLFISHNLGVVRRIADQVAVMYAGQVVETGPTAQVLRSPLHPYAKGLIAAIPRLGTRQERLASIPGRLPDLRRLPEGCRFEARCPFAQNACSAAQALVRVDGHPDRTARCQFAAASAAVAWPIETAASAPARPQNSHAPVLELDSLVRRFAIGRGRLRFDRGWPRVERSNITAVDSVTLAVRPGEVLGLVGESGSGKTTLGRIALRLIEPDSGNIRVDGESIIGLPQSALEAMRRKAQIVFQNPDSSLNPRKTVLELIGRPIERFGLAPASEIPSRVRQILDLVRLPAHYAHRYPHQMSGGEKQRVGIARALATEPRFIVCDEPVSALDVSVQAAIVNLLADLRDRLQVAYLFISHDIAVVAHLADRIAVMNQGRIVEIDETERITRSPSHPYTARLIAAVPRIDSDPITLVRSTPAHR